MSDTADTTGVRAELRRTPPQAPRRLRVVVVTRLAGGGTGPGAQLVRAVRTLGHHVVHLDPTDHRVLLLRRWRPDVLAVAGDGLVTDPATDLSGATVVDLTDLLGAGAAWEVLVADVPPDPAAGADVLAVTSGPPAPRHATGLDALVRGRRSVRLLDLAASGAPRGLALLQALDAAPVVLDLTPAGGSGSAEHAQVLSTAAARGCHVVRWGPDDEPLPAVDVDPAGRAERVRRAAGAGLLEHRVTQRLAGLGRDDRPEPGPPRVVAVSGWYGAANTGDDLILEAVAGALEQRVPDVLVEVAASDPRRVLAQHGLAAFRRTDTVAAEAVARRSTAVVHGGGGLWHDHGFALNGGLAGTFTGAKGSPSGQAALPLMGVMLGARYDVVGMGVGPLRDPDAAAVVAHLAGHADTVTVRDEPSRALLESLPDHGGRRPPVTVAPDVVYGLSLPDPLPAPRPQVTAGDRPVIAVSLREWPRRGAALDALPRLLDDLADRLGARVVGVPMMAADRDLLRRVLAGLRAPTEVLGRSADAGQLVADLAACRLLVAMRLHAALLGHRAGVPVVALGYDDKVRHHLDQLDRGHLLVDLDDPPEVLAAALATAAAEQRLPAATRETVTRLEQDAAAALAGVADRIAATPPAPARPAPVRWEGPATVPAWTVGSGPGHRRRTGLRIVLFDGLLEEHVPDALDRALRERGHEVLRTGRVWHGTKMPRTPQDRAALHAVVDTVLDARPDAVLTFRPAALRPEQTERLRARGVRLLAWFSDDPVLFAESTREMAGLYDVTLHTGGEETLALYEADGHLGVTMPFFADPRVFPRRWAGPAAEHDVVFLGNTHTGVKRHRYDVLAATGLPVRIFGKVAEDPAGLHAGVLSSDAEVADLLARTRIGVNIPQRFADYAGSRHDFPQLAGLGEFVTPSRVVQYAATGVPQVTYRHTEPADDEAPGVVVRAGEDLGAALRDLLADPDRQAELSRAGYEWFRRWYTADSRARLVEELVVNPGTVSWLDRTSRARLYRLYEGRVDTGVEEVTR